MFSQQRSQEKSTREVLPLLCLCYQHSASLFGFWWKAEDGGIEPPGVTLRNFHKNHGNRRSKLEYWLEEQLSKLYPELEIHFNRRDAINAELDIYIPSLNLAFELNGIFHYEPIYGAEKLASIQNNDKRKFQACLKNKIELAFINCSQQKKFNKSSSQKYLDVITSIINSKVSDGA